MGFLEELGIDPDEIEPTSYAEPDPGFYQFEISEAAVVNGTSKDEDVVKFRITYALYDDDDQPAGSKSEWWTLFEVAGEEPGEKAQKSRGYLVGRLKDLGLPANAEVDEIEGVTGTLRIVANGEYTNIRNVKGSPKAAPAKAAAKAAPAAKAGTAKANPFKKS